jgi:hypothetical protein
MNAIFVLDRHCCGKLNKNKLIQYVKEIIAASATQTLLFSVKKIVNFLTLLTIKPAFVIRMINDSV